MWLKLSLWTCRARPKLFHALCLSQQPQSGLLRPQPRLSLRKGFMKPNPKIVFLSFSILTLGSCVTQSSPVAAQPSCCVKAETPAAFTDKSIFQTESTWTTDLGKHIKLSALAGRPQVVAMFFANCQFACPIIVNDMNIITILNAPGEIHVPFSPSPANASSSL